jgi:ABC-type branched-subunit amino acid transport system ATPase component
VLALADRVFALERGAVFHEGPSAPLLTNLAYRKQVLWLGDSTAKSQQEIA